jgi:hypothetical protein
MGKDKRGHRRLTTNPTLWTCGGARGEFPRNMLEVLTQKEIRYSSRTRAGESSRPSASPFPFDEYEAKAASRLKDG